jgi:hypothetical protein
MNLCRNQYTISDFTAERHHRRSSLFVVPKVLDKRLNGWRTLVSTKTTGTGTIPSHNLTHFFCEIVPLKTVYISESLTWNL